MHNKILVTQSSIPPFDEYMDEIKDIWKTHWLTNMGAKHRSLQHELRAIWVLKILIFLRMDIWH